MILKYIDEHPVEKATQPSSIEEMTEHNQILNKEGRLSQFMETCKRESEQYIAIKKADEEKLAKVLEHHDRHSGQEA